MLRFGGFDPDVEADEFAFDLDIAWPGGLKVPKLETVAGQVTMNMERGRFLTVKAGSRITSRLLGLLNPSMILRRLRLDFSDIYDRGTAFEKVTGTFELKQEQLMTRGPTRIVSPATQIELLGSLDMQSLELRGELVATLPVSRSLPWYAAYLAVLNPLAGAGVLVAEQALQVPIDKLSSARYRIDGTLDNPKVEFDRVFKNDMDISPEVEAPQADGDDLSRAPPPDARAAPQGASPVAGR